MLAAAVHPGEGFFVKETGKALLLGHLAEDLHHQLVVVTGDIAPLVNQGCHPPGGADGQGPGAG